ncbi:MAG: DUF952 domain-containing protein [Pseudomonadota bacterium]
MAVGLLPQAHAETAIREGGVALSPRVFKIVPSELWMQAERAGRFSGSPVDAADGYIHFSTAAQVRETARRHFAGQDNLLLVEVDATRLGAALRWEPSRGGDLFPHLYGDLLLEAVLSVAPLPLGGDGAHVFGDLEAVPLGLNPPDR